ncbi:MAG: CysB family HTH-type transcriptional regulator [Pseudohongiellaceae bacterium]|jgi:LysR family cys regulon transcriptional activator
MNFQQLRIIRETLRCQFNLTEVASRLYTSQSGVSKHIKDLEDELGLALFERKGKRLLGLTAPGRELAKIVERMLLDAQSIKNLAEQYSQQDQGTLTVATTHTQARYMLPAVVAQFRLRYPKVKLHLHQGSPQEIAQMLTSGEADIGIATEALGEVEGLITYPFHRWHHAVVVPAGHALEKQVAKLAKAGRQLALKDIAAYPIITYHEGFTGRAVLEKTFQAAGLTPEIVLSALDADVIKSYVELGLGIGIVAALAFNPERDLTLRLLDCTHLFPANLTRIAVREGQLQRQFADDFIALCTNSCKD